MFAEVCLKEEAHDALLGLQEFMYVRVAGIIVGVAVKQTPRRAIFGIVRAESQREGKRLNCVEWECIKLVVWFLACGVHTQWMRMVINCFDLVDFGKELSVCTELPEDVR